MNDNPPLVVPALPGGLSRGATHQFSDDSPVKHYGISELVARITQVDVNRHVASTDARSVANTDAVPTHVPKPHSTFFTPPVFGGAGGALPASESSAAAVTTVNRALQQAGIPATVGDPVSVWSDDAKGVAEGTVQAATDGTSRLSVVHADGRVLATCTATELKHFLEVRSGRAVSTTRAAQHQQRASPRV